MEQNDQGGNAFERALQEKKTSKYVLRLFVAGMTPQSSRAIANLNKICEEICRTL